VRATKLGAFDFIEKAALARKNNLLVRNAVQQRAWRKENQLLRTELGIVSGYRQQRAIEALRQQMRDGADERPRPDYGETAPARNWWLTPARASLRIKGLF